MDCNLIGVMKLNLSDFQYILIWLHLTLFKWKGIWGAKKRKDWKREGQHTIASNQVYNILQRFSQRLQRLFAEVCGFFQSHKPKSCSVNGIYEPEVRTVVFWLKFDVKIQLPAWMILFLVSERWHHRSLLIHDRMIA